MTMNSKHFLIGSFVLASVSVLAVAAQQNSTQDTTATKKASARKTVTQQQDEGEQVFQRHCSRCHTAPDGFSPHIAGTVVRHMRVRASLSQHEEEALLRFLNP